MTKPNTNTPPLTPTGREQLYTRHIDIQIDGFDPEACEKLGHELEELLSKHTDKWHNNGKFKTILGMQQRSYHTRGIFTHWLDAWKDARKELPDDEITVLVELADGEIWTGFHEDGQWRYQSADPITTPVLRWAEFPEPPKSNTVQSLP